LTTYCVSTFRIVGQLSDRCLKRVDVPEWNDTTDVWPRNDVTDAAHIGTDRSDAGRHCLDQRNWSPLVARCQDENVGSTVDCFEITAPSEEPGVVLDPETSHLHFEIRSKLAVANEQEQKPRRPPNQPLSHPQKQYLLLDSGQPAHRNHHGSLFGDGQASSCSKAVGLRQRQQFVEMEPERNDTNLSLVPEAVCLAQIAFDVAGDDDQDIRALRQPSLYQKEQACGDRVEVSFEHVAMICVNKTRTAAA
jgi:hypothetical protein